MSFCHLRLKLFLKVHFSKVCIYFQLVILNVKSYCYFLNSITLSEKIRCHHMIDCICLIMTIGVPKYIVCKNSLVSHVPSKNSFHAKKYAKIYKALSIQV